MTGEGTQRRTRYPEIESYRTGILRVSELHEIYWEESGNPQGKPVVFIHGGPGGATEPKQRRFFDPSVTTSSTAPFSHETGNSSRISDASATSPP